MHDFAVFCFVLATGITLSGIVANIYRLLAVEAKTAVGKTLDSAVMIFGGPVIFIGNATQSFRKKDCSAAGYVLALALCGFWSFITGLFILAVVISLKA